MFLKLVEMLSSMMPVKLRQNMRRNMQRANLRNTESYKTICLSRILISSTKEMISFH